MEQVIYIQMHATQHTISNAALKIESKLQAITSNEITNQEPMPMFSSSHLYISDGTRLLNHFQQFDLCLPESPPQAAQSQLPHQAVQQTPLWNQLDSSRHLLPSLFRPCQVYLQEWEQSLKVR